MSSSSAFTGGLAENVPVGSEIQLCSAPVPPHTFSIENSVHVCLQLFIWFFWCVY